MAKFPLRGTTIIKLTAVYSLIIGLWGGIGWINVFIATSKTAHPIGIVALILGLLFIAIPSLIHALMLYKLWRGAWRFTIILYGILFISGLYSVLSNRFANYSLATLLNLVVAGAVVSIFWTNLEVKAALGKFKNAASLSVDVDAPKP